MVAVAFAAYAVRVLALLTRFDGYELGKYLLADDAFYYLRIAHNIARGHGSTFDGTAVTNGYQPLWETICVALSLFFPAARRAEISVVVAIQAALDAVAAWMIFAALKPLHALGAAVATALLLASAAVQGTLMDGMESSLAFALLAVLLRVGLARSSRFVILDTGRYATAMFGLLAALALTRLEMGLVAAAFLGCSLWRSRGGDPARRAARVRALLVLAGLAGLAGAYLAVNWRIAHWPLPLSGTIEWAETFSLSDQLAVAGRHLRAFVGPLRIHQAIQVPLLEIPIGILLAGALVAATTRHRALQQVALPLGLPCLVHTLLAIRHGRGFQWYGWPALFLGTVATFAVVERGLALLRRHRPRWGGRAALALVTLVCVFTAAATAGRVRRSGFDRLYDWSLPPTLMDHAIRFIEDRIPGDELLAGHSIGLVAYMTDRGIVHTEGLVNDRAYFEALRAGRQAESLRRRGVRWLMANVQDAADEAGRRALFPRCALARRFSVRDVYDLDAAPSLGSADVVFFQIDHTPCPPAGAEVPRTW